MRWTAFHVSTPVLLIAYCFSVVFFTVPYLEEIEHSSMTTVLAMLITLPWSFVFRPIIAWLTPPDFSDSDLPFFIMILLSASINIVLLFVLSRKANSRADKRPPRIS